MGDLVPMADYVGDPDAGTDWFRPPRTDWDPCAPCPVRAICREVRECHDITARDDAPAPDITLRLVPPPDNVA